MHTTVLPDHHLTEKIPYIEEKRSAMSFHMSIHCKKHSANTNINT